MKLTTTLLSRAGAIHTVHSCVPRQNVLGPQRSGLVLSMFRGHQSQLCVFEGTESSFANIEGVLVIHVL